MKIVASVFGAVCWSLLGWLSGREDGHEVGENRDMLEPSGMDWNPTDV